MQNEKIGTGLTIRAFIGLAVMAVAFLALIVRIFSLQTVDFDYYKNKVIDQLTTESTIISERGNIYDSNGNPTGKKITRGKDKLNENEFIKRSQRTTKC